MSIKQHKTTLLLFTLIFLFSFFWIFALTHNFPLFWEDSSIVEGYKAYAKNPEQYSYSALFSRFAGMFVETGRFYQVAYMSRPLGDIFLSPFVPAIFGFNPFILRLF